ncbi:MAG: hypothetical protein RLZZ453_671 [Chlamydiota bacterium]|jgi:tRNA pseudouridine38-40 synthase
MENPCAHNYLLLIAYEGTSYGGWQVQTNAPSIQAVIQDVLRKILQEEVSLVGSGRTDAGVHALGQAAHFKTKKEISTHKTLASLNSLLPPDIRILSIQEVPFFFHARYSATRKTYRYYLHITKDPFLFPFSYHPPHPIPLDCLKSSAHHFLGTHDFTSFAHEAHRGTAAHDPVRTLFRLDVTSLGTQVILEFEGDGFLYKMVRNITGTLLNVCAGKIKEQDLPVILKAKDRRQAGSTAPPQGLFLVKVDYNNFFQSNRSHTSAPIS